MPQRHSGTTATMRMQMWTERKGMSLEWTVRAQGVTAWCFWWMLPRRCSPRGEDGGWRAMRTMQCVRNVYTSKIISTDKDLVALVFYGTEQSKNPRNSFKHVYIYHDLDSPGARRMQDVDV
ncbi:unnamed protein product [Coregonus sp. 'balchen']|nr:unnamed protein product [Coregonus sp. 'balchen']